jgi:hypothetical protein
MLYWRHQEELRILADVTPTVKNNFFVVLGDALTKAASSIESFLELLQYQVFLSAVFLFAANFCVVGRRWFGIVFFIFLFFFSVAISIVQYYLYESFGLLSSSLRQEDLLVTLTFIVSNYFVYRWLYHLETKNF